MPIIRPCPQCGGPAYARRASDTARLCRSCYRTAPKRFGKVYLKDSDTPMPPEKQRITFKRRKPNYLPSSETPSVPLVSFEEYLSRFAGDGAEGLKRTLRQQMEEQIDAYWEKHPELTRVQASRRVKK